MKPYDRFPLTYEGGARTPRNGGYPPSIPDETRELETEMHNKFSDKLIDRLSDEKIEQENKTLAQWIIEAEGDLESFELN